MGFVEILIGVAFLVFSLLVGVGVNVAMSDASATEFWVARIFFIAAAIELVGLSTYWLYVSVWPLVARLIIAAFVGVIVMPATIGSLAWVDSRQERVREQLPPPKPKPPDVTLSFVYPKTPALVIANLSDSVARDIKWTVALWNIDLPDRNDPLPIPVSTFDWIKPHEKGGPQDLFGGPLVAPLLKPTNRLFGSASVSCPECSRGRTYIVYIVWGSHGWFSEIENEKSGNLIIPVNFLKETREAYFKALEAAVPKESRIPIAER